jgi:hypothetical protein
MNDPQMRRMLAVAALSMTAAAAAMLAPLHAADVKVDLSKEKVGAPPATFEPMVGSWVVAQDAGEPCPPRRRSPSLRTPRRCRLPAPTPSASPRRASRRKRWPG